MTVRVNKSAFNIREKLSELAVKFGLKGSELARAETVQDARDLISSGRKNIIHNGAMQVAQRGTEVTSVVNAGLHTVDRFSFFLSNLGTWTVQQSTDAPDGFTKSFRVLCTTADASPAAGDRANISYSIEGHDCQRILSSSTSTHPLQLSFWVKSNRVGAATLGIFQPDNSLRLFSTTYTIESSNVWQRVVISIPVDIAAGINDDNGSGLAFEWWMNGGSAYSGGTLQERWMAFDSTVRNARNLGVGTEIGDQFLLTGVQLEVGKNVTEFEYRPYGEELALCQRYYLRLNSQGSNHPIANVYGESGSQVYGTFHFPVQMRDAPTFSYSATNHFSVVGGGTVTSGPTMFNSTYLTAGIGANTAGSGTLAATAAGQLRFTSGAGWIAFAADI